MSDILWEEKSRMEENKKDDDVMLEEFDFDESVEELMLSDDICQARVI